MPSVLSASSTPSHFERSQRPAHSAAWAWGMLRAWASSSAIVCSAAERTFDCGAFTTITPCAVAASTSTLSSPMPARPTTTRSLPGGQHVGGDLGGRADDQGVGAGHGRRAAASGSRPSWTSTSWPAARRRSSPLSAIFSVTRMRAIAGVWSAARQRLPTGSRAGLGQHGAAQAADGDRRRSPGSIPPSTAGSGAMPARRRGRRSAPARRPSPRRAGRCGRRPASRRGTISGGHMHPPSIPIATASGIPIACAWSASRHRRPDEQPDGRGERREHQRRARRPPAGRPSVTPKATRADARISADWTSEKRSLDDADPQQDPAGAVGRGQHPPDQARPCGRWRGSCSRRRC